MYYYISKGPEGSAVVHTAPPEDRDYFTVEELPEGDGRLMIGPGNTLYRAPFPAPEPEPEAGRALEERVAAMEEAIGRGLLL